MDGPDEAAEMAAHFRRVQELFGGGSGQQVAALARQLRTAVDVESVRARLQCVCQMLRWLMISVFLLHLMLPSTQHARFTDHTILQYDQASCTIAAARGAMGLPA